MKNLLGLITLPVIMSFVMVPLTYAAGEMPEGTQQFEQQNSDKAQQGQQLINEQPMKSQQQTQQTSGTTIKGDVLKKEGEFYTIHDTAGHDVRVHVDKSTKLDGSLPFLVGDEVEAQVTAQGHALAIKHASAFGMGGLGPQAISGDVLKIEGDMYTVHDTAGHEVRIHVDKSTKRDGSLPFLVGDKVDVQVTDQGHALSIKHAAEGK
jgi:ribosomal protein S1